MRYACVRQYDETDCAAACLATVARHYGRKASLARIRRAAGIDAEGANVRGVIEAAKELGLAAEGAKGDADALYSGITLPAIAHITTEDGFLHFVVIHAIEKERLIIADPAKGILTMPRSEFLGKWSGMIVLLAPSSDFEKCRDAQSLFSRFRALLAPQRRMIVGIFGISLIITAVGILSAFYFQALIDFVIPANDFRMLGLVSAAVIGLSIVGILLSFARSELFLHLSKKLDLALLLGYYDHTMDLPMDFFSTRKSGEILSRYQDATTIRTAISQATLSVMIDVLMVIVGAVILYIQSPILFFIALTAAVLYFFVALAFGKTYERANKRQLEDNAQMNAWLVESLNGIETIKAFADESRVKHVAEGKLKQLLESVIHLGHVTNIQERLKALIGSCGGVAILWVGVSLILSGEMSLGQLISFNALLVYFLEPIKRLVGLQPTIQTAVVAAERLSDVFDLDTEEQEDAGARLRPDEVSGAIRFSNVDFRYGSRRLVLEGFNIEIGQGESIAIVGESGAGKTTVAKLLLRYFPCEKGSISIGEVPLTDIDSRALRRRVGYIPQQTFLFSGSLFDNLTLGMTDTEREALSLEHIRSCLQVAQLDEWVAGLPAGLYTKIGENGENLSGGQRQRLAIARALLKKPDILVLDEATSNLDAITEAAFQEAVSKQHSGITTIVIAHRLSTIKRCDRIIVMSKGCVAEQGTHEELLQNGGLYTKLCNTSPLSSFPL